MRNININIKFSDNRAKTFECHLQSMNNWVGTENIDFLATIMHLLCLLNPRNSNQYLLLYFSS